MANTREVKTRLRGVRKTQQITRAMKMVAAVKLRHAQAALANGRPYAERMRALAAELLVRIEPPFPSNPFFSPSFARKPCGPACIAMRSIAGGLPQGGSPVAPKELWQDKMAFLASDGSAKMPRGLPRGASQRQITQATPRRENILMIIVAADRGLCGNMNTNVFRQVLRAIDDLKTPVNKETKPEINLYLIGRKAKDFFRARQNVQAENLPYRIRETVNFAGMDAGRLGRQCCELYRKGEFDRIEVFYNESSSGLQHRPVRLALFPLNVAQMRKDALPAAGNVLFESDCALMLDDVIYGYIASEMRRILVEAEVAEHAARMFMMDLATKNADDLIAAMQLTMNKLRQLSITNELEDITTGAEAVG